MKLAISICLLSSLAIYWSDIIQSQMLTKEYEGYELAIPTTTFNDVVGLHHAKQCILELIKFIKNPESYTETKNIPLRGMLFYGQPGTGKSFFTEAAVKEIIEATKQFTFYLLNEGDILANGTEELVNIIKNKAPCIIVISSIDTFYSLSVNNVLDHLSNIMQEPMSTDPEKQVIIVTETSHTEKIDTALLPSGQFGTCLLFEMPNTQERLEFLQKQLSKLYVDLSQFDLNKTALITHGCIYEHLNSAINAMVRRSKDYGIPMDQLLLDEMVDLEMRYFLGA